MVHQLQIVFKTYARPPCISSQNLIEILPVIENQIRLKRGKNKAYTEPNDGSINFELSLKPMPDLHTTSHKIWKKSFCSLETVEKEIGLKEGKIRLILNPMMCPSTSNCVLNQC